MRQVALITGGTSGIGLRLVKDFAMMGYKVYSVSKDQEKIAKISVEVPYVEFLCGDVSKEETFKMVYDRIKYDFGKLDVLINNAGSITAGGIESLDTEDWYEMFDINVNSVFYGVKALLPLLKESGNGRIINISSISANIPGSSIAYSACKAAVDSMTRSLAKELAGYRIRVNSVNPGIVNTGFQIHNGLMHENMYKGFINTAEEDYPLGAGEPEDVSNLVLFLAAEENKWITGSSYIIDGGRSLGI